MTFCEDRHESSADTQKSLQSLSLNALAAIGNSIPAGIIVISVDEKIVYSNKRAIQIFGFNPVGLGLKEYALNMAKARKLENSPYLYEQLPLIKALLYRQTTHDQEIIIQKPDQSQITLSANATPLIDTKGNITGALAIFEDITDRKKIEDELKESERKYSILVEHPNSIVMTVDKNLRITFMNKFGLNFFGYTAEEITGKNVIGITIPAIDDEGNDLAKMAQDIANNIEKYSTNVHKNMLRDGRLVWISWTNSGIYEDGELSEIIAVGNDISKLKEAEEALKKNEQLYHTLFDNSQDGFQLLELIYDKKGHPIDFRYLRVNSAFELMVGRKARDIIGKTAHEVFPNYEPIWLERPQKVLESGKAQHIESYSSPINKYLDLYYFPYDKNKVGTLFRDITQRKKAEKALRRSEERYRELFESMTEGYELCELVFNDKCEAIDYIIHDVNPAYEKESGLKREQVIGKRVTDILSIVEPVWFQRYSEVVKSGKAAKFEEYNAAIARWFRVYAYPLPEKNWFSVIFSDITERKNLEMLLQEKERLAAIGATAGMVGHDIRNPLQAITGDVYLLKDYLSAIHEMPTKIDIAESLEEIEKNIGYINKIVADLQDYAKQMTPKYSEVNFYELVTNVFRSIAIPEDVSPSIEVEQSLILHTDPTLFQRILTNLIVNAMQAMPKGGQLKIGAKANNSQVTVTVSDTGVGIPEHVKPKLFTPMMTTKAKGQGLGLAVVKKSVEALGGSITFESQEEKGTKFIITLPP